MTVHCPPERPRAVVVIAIGLTLASLSAVAGCARIPTTGPVLSGRVVEVDRQAGIVQLGGDGPVSGATPTAVVSGFLLVAAGFSDNHRVARSFLTDKRQLAWRPDAEAALYPTRSVLKFKEIGVDPEATPTPTPVPATAADSRDSGPDGRPATTQVTVTTPIDAQIDGDSRYRLAAPGATVTKTFGLIKVAGEWRIDHLDDGILISDVDFNVTFRPFSVYFGDPTGRFLVPDQHWFPATRETPSGGPELPTTLVRALLQGPPPWLAGAVVSGAPANTRMAVGAVVVADDVATVDLTDQVREASPRDRQLLVSQLQATLAQLRIASVQITVLRLAFDVPARSGDDGDPSQPDGQPVVDPGVDSRPVVIDSKGRLARLEGQTLEVLKDVAQLGVAGANRPAVAYDSSAYAVLNADRSKLLLQLPGAKVVSLITSAGLTAPSFDPEGWVWSAPGTNTGFVYAAEADSGPVKVKATWLKGVRVVSMRISRDSTRALIATQVGGKAHVWLTGVVRDADGQPQSLNYPQPELFPGLQTIRDVAWMEENRVVVLGRRRGTPTEGPWLVQIGGSWGTMNAAVSGAESITAGKGEASVLAGTAKGLQERSGSLWETVSPGQWPAFPG